MSTVLTVRTARPEEADLVAELARTTFPLACPPELGADDIAAFVAAQLSAERFLAHIGSPSTQVLVAGRAGALVGYALVHDEDPPGSVVALLGPGRAVELGKFFLAAGEHGRGTAHELMGAVLRQAEAFGAGQVWLGVSRDNARANRFYERHGFELVGTKSFTVGSVTLPEDFVRVRVLDAGRARTASSS